jgi:hypothetical protein
MAKKISEVLRQRAASVSFLAQLDAAEHAAQQITRHKDQIGVLRSWAVKGFDKGAVFDDLKPSAISRLLAASLEASENIGRAVVSLDSTMLDVLTDAVKVNVR